MIKCKISSVKLISFVIKSMRFIYRNGYTGIIIHEEDR